MVGALSQWFSNPPWYAPVILGLVLGALSRELVPRIYNLISSRIQYDPIKGIWYCSHLTYDPKGKLVVKHAKWKFTPRRTLGKLKLRVFGSEDQVVFSGLVESTEESYRFFIEGPQNETACLRMKKVFPDQKETFGIWLGIDFRGKIIASARVLTRQPITEDQFRSITQQCYQRNANYPVISASEQCDVLSEEEPEHLHVHVQDLIEVSTISGNADREERA